jgi:hypothetical protein
VASAGRKDDDIASTQLDFLTTAYVVVATANQERRLAPEHA